MLYFNFCIFVCNFIFLYFLYFNLFRFLSSLHNTYNAYHFNQKGDIFN